MSFTNLDINDNVREAFAYTSDTVADLPTPERTPAWAVTADNHFCVWSGSSWVVTGIGATGATGLKGATGPAGPQGATGASGVA
jgi:hypothetical protein